MFGLVEIVLILKLIFSTALIIAFIVFSNKLYLYFKHRPGNSFPLTALGITSLALGLSFFDKLLVCVPFISTGIILILFGIGLQKRQRA